MLIYSLLYFIYLWLEKIQTVLESKLSVLCFIMDSLKVIKVMQRLNPGEITIGISTLQNYI